MKRLLLILLAASTVAAHAQEAPDYAPSAYAGPFDEMHVAEKQREQIAIGLRVQQLLNVASARNEARYVENRRRCHAALKVAELCGTFAGTFYCDEKGFQPIAPGLVVKPAALDNRSRYQMERCAIDAAKRNP